MNDLAGLSMKENAKTTVEDNDFANSGGESNYYRSLSRALRDL